MKGFKTHARARLILDGGGYFGGERKFRVTLYDECKRREIKLLTISKNSPSRAEKRDKANYELPASKTLSQMDSRLKQLSEQEKSVLRLAITSAHFQLFLRIFSFPS